MTYKLQSSTSLKIMVRLINCKNRAPTEAWKMASSGSTRYRKSSGRVSSARMSSMSGGMVLNELRLMCGGFPWQIADQQSEAYTAHQSFFLTLFSHGSMLQRVGS